LALAINKLGLGRFGGISWAGDCIVTAIFVRGIATFRFFPFYSLRRTGRFDTTDLFVWLLVQGIDVAQLNPLTLAIRTYSTFDQFCCLNMVPVKELFRQDMLVQANSCFLRIGLSKLKVSMVVYNFLVQPLAVATLGFLQFDGGPRSETVALDRQ